MSLLSKNVLLGQEALPSGWHMRERREVFERGTKTIPYLEALQSGGALYISAHVLMVLCFVLAVRSFFRRTSVQIAALMGFAPFFFASLAMLISVVQLEDARTSEYWFYLGSGHNPPGLGISELRGIPRPLYIGIALSLFVLLLHLARHFGSRRRT